MAGFKNLRKAVENKKMELSGFEGMFLSTYEKALIKHEREHQQYVPSDYFRPSSLYGCKRMLYYTRMGAEGSEEFEPNLIGICDSGTDRHARIQNIVSKMEGLKTLDIEEVVKEANQMGLDTVFHGWNSDRTEARCSSKKYSIYFQADGVFNFLGKDCLLEIKTESTYSFNKRYEPKPEHIIQATSYALGLGLRYVLFFYEDRNFTAHKLYFVEITDEMKQMVIDKIQETNGYIERKELPPKEEDKCTYCKFKKQCSADYNFEPIIITAEADIEQVI